MADLLVSRSIPSLYNGISQQNPTLRQPSQSEAQVNMYGTVMDGLRKRAPFKHIAKVTTLDISTAKIHTINRDVSERYIVVVTDGDLKVYDSQTGVEKTVAFPTGKAYLTLVGGGNANLLFGLNTVADYTFLVNKTVVGATKVTPTVTPPNYANWHHPSIWGYRNDSRYFSPNGAGTLKGTVNTFSDLPHPEDPAPPVEGDLYKVVGFDENNFGGYYVRRTGGVWQEHYGVGENVSLDELTLPHALIRESDGTFTFTPFAWAPRRFGDSETNQVPSFIGRTLNGVFYWKNRLGFLTDENVVFSGAGDFGNFFRNTVTTLLDSDIVDVAVSTNKVSILKFAVPFQNSMMLFADQSQFNLNVRDLLTPTSVSIDEATSYEMNTDVPPIGVGSEVYFTSTSGSWTRLREYFVHPEALNTDAADVTAHAQHFIPNEITSMAGTSIEDCIFLTTAKTGFKNRLYLYKFFWTGDEKVQSAHNYWEVGATDEILSVNMIENIVYCLIKRSDGTFLESADLDVNAETLSIGFDILLDRRYEVQPSDMVYSAGLDETTITLPYDTTEEAATQVITTVGSGSVGSLMDPTLYTFPPAPGNTIEVPGDVTAKAPVVGVKYSALQHFSEQFVYDSNANAQTDGRLQLRTMTITYQDAAFFQTRVYPYGLTFAADVESIVPAALDAFTGRTLGEANLITGEAAFHTGDYTFYIDGTSTDVVIQLINDSHLQAKFTSAKWEGLFTKRSRSI